MTDELKPCPFCGDRGGIETFAAPHTNAPNYSIFCEVCHASSSAELTREDAIAAWNTRDQSLSERNAELKKRFDTEHIVTGAQRHEIAHLRKALVAHNEALRSAASAIARRGGDTNWVGLHNCVQNVLIEHHEITNEARASLTKGGK